MARTITREVTTTVIETMTDEQELAALRDAASYGVNGRATNPGYLPENTAVKATRPREKLKAGMIAITTRAGPPDSDNEYHVAYLAEDSTVAHTYIKAGSVRRYDPDAPIVGCRRRPVSHPTARARTVVLEEEPAS